VIDGHDYLLDVAIAHPCKPDDSPIPSHRTLNRRSAKLPSGKTAQLAEKDNIDQYGPTTQAAGFRLVPFAAETFGRWGEKTVDFLKTLSSGSPARS